ncbi:MAG: CCA tRNA nucleotidyltransferase [Planctomycetota bacterium]
MSDTQPGPSGASAEHRRAAVHVASVLRDAGKTAYFAGGCVRDELLGLAPTDYDVATDATPDVVQSLFRSTAHVGVSFGVVIVRLSRADRIGLSAPRQVEVATFRADGDYADRRRPDSVRFATETEDAKRRDFTINALFLDPIAPADGEAIGGHVIDHVGGVGDLHAGIVRAVGAPADRLAEDHLRALRAARFAARLGFSIEPETAEAIRAHASELAGVSTERIGEEVRRMLAHPSRASALALLRSLGLEASAVGPPTSDGLARVGSLPPDADVPTSLAAWAVDRGDLGAPFRTRLCLSNEHTAGFQATITTLERLRHDWPSLGTAGRKRIAASGTFAGALAVLAGESAPAADRIRSDAADLAGQPGGLAPEPLLTGADLIEAGFTPGPAFGLAIDRAYDAQLEGRAGSVEACLEIASRILESVPPGNRSSGGASEKR